MHISLDAAALSRLLLVQMGAVIDLSQMVKHMFLMQWHYGSRLLLSVWLLNKRWVLMLSDGTIWPRGKRCIWYDTVQNNPIRYDTIRSQKRSAVSNVNQSQINVAFALTPFNAFGCVWTPLTMLDACECGGPSHRIARFHLRSCWRRRWRTNVVICSGWHQRECYIEI